MACLFRDAAEGDVLSRSAAGLSRDEAVLSRSAALLSRDEAGQSQDQDEALLSRDGAVLLRDEALLSRPDFLDCRYCDCRSCSSGNGGSLSKVYRLAVWRAECTVLTRSCTVLTSSRRDGTSGSRRSGDLDQAMEVDIGDVGGMIYGDRGEKESGTVALWFVLEDRSGPVVLFDAVFVFFSVRF